MNYAQAKKILDEHKNDAKYILVAITPDDVSNFCNNNDIEEPSEKGIQIILNALDSKIEQLDSDSICSVCDDLYQVIENEIECLINENKGA